LEERGWIGKGCAKPGVFIARSPLYSATARSSSASELLLCHHECCRRLARHPCICSRFRVYRDTHLAINEKRLPAA